MEKIYYKSKLLTLAEVRKKVKGRSTSIIRIVENDAVVVLPLIGKHRILLEIQHRPAVGKHIYELPAGHIEKGESPAEAVKRELKEETGYVPKEVRFMFKAYQEPGANTSLHWFYRASNFKIEAAAPEIDEDIRIKIVTLGRALAMIRNNSIIDTKTIAAILYYVHFVEKMGYT
ncbi:MAG: NUDIX hydrolase [Candidatus Micrarchaeaceae archaeon]